MNPHIMQGKIDMPLFKDFVPKWIRPWIYLFFAFVFQLSDCIYVGSLNHIVGTTPLIKEDVMMIMFFALVGVNMPFPFFFRLKFRFKNKQMLLTCAVVILIANLVGMHSTSMIVLCPMAYLAGFCKLWGTFECMSNIQLWLTPERDFSIFFPFLYILVLGDIQFSDIVCTYVNYYFPWQYVNYLVIALLLIIILILVTSTKMFHFMKPMPLYGMDWLGCILWSALLLEIIYLFNYGEYYNWWDGVNIRRMTFVAIITGYFCINRMRHIRHPYIAPEAWKYKNLLPILILFFVSELLCSTPTVLQNALAEGVLHFDSLHTVLFSFLVIAGIVIGCMFTLIWINQFRLSYVRLLCIGYAALVAYQIMMYYFVSPGLNIERLYLPNILRGFGYSVVFCALTIYLEELMPFQHFFHGLFIVGIVRTGLGAAIGSAIYGFGMRYYMADNIVRYIGTPLSKVPTFFKQLEMISIKQLFGWTCLVGLAFLLFFLLFDVPPFRNRLKRMPYWNVLGRVMKKEWKRSKIVASSK